MSEPSALTYTDNRPRLLGSASVRGCCSGREVGDEYKSQGQGEAMVRFLSFPSRPTSFLSLLLLPLPSAARPAPPFAPPTPLVARSLTLRLGRGYVYSCLLLSLLLTHFAGSSVSFSYLLPGKHALPRSLSILTDASISSLPTRLLSPIHLP